MLSELLRKNGTGYPADYVIARIRGRRTRFAADRPALVTQAARRGTSDEEIWRVVTGEFAWLHRQLTPDWRDAVAPLLALFELKTIVLAIRNTAIDRQLAVRTVLERSLLSDPVRRAVADAPDVRAAVDALVIPLTRLAAPFGELATAYADDQLRGFEDTLMRVYLEQAAAAPLHPAVRAFLVSFIDARNVMVLYKQLRWNMASGDRFIAGGTLAPDVFEGARARRDPAAVDALVTHVTRRHGRGAAGREQALETVLLNSLTTRVDRARRDGDGVAAIVAYLWRVYVQARNLSILHHAGDVDAEAVQRELVQ